jgi:hypothetical protein
MDANFPTPITDISDLEFYQNFLKEEFPQKEPSTLKEKLKTLIGNQIKIESAIGSRIEIRTGRLLEVGDDFIVIKPMQSNVEIMLYINSVKFLTVLKNNIRKPYT